ncbi:MAG: glycerol-3-phosphate dehydrogenase/oxidase [Chloroflexota bacterium]|nr:glycerol-3-phosphate dehydrogenase/oxidase [Chloroflexota bacterium]
MGTQENRDTTWSRLDQAWDIIIVGGGITGAGILREASRLGLKALLLEQRDFAWGTSSRSSKLVHGGLRYLKQGKIRLTRASVRERQRLLSEGPGLIDPLGFLLTSYEGDNPGSWTFRAGLSIYDLLALQWSHRRYEPQEMQMLAPHITQDKLQGGLQYGDAQTDDARLVLRVIQEAMADGGRAINYARVESLLQDDDGQVTGVIVRDLAGDGSDELPLDSGGRTAMVTATIVINATGAWADRLRREIGQEPKIRALRGSHLIFPTWRLPVAQAISFLHPIDRRPVFIFPWEGITLVGTTDLDHDQSMDDEPRISPNEVAYLMAAVEGQFPSLNIGLKDVISTFSGVRPVVATGQADPSRESRDHVVWDERGMLTVTGGKLTTFRLIALDALKAVRDRLPQTSEPDRDRPVLDSVDVDLWPGHSLDERARRRLLGHYGLRAYELVETANPEELQRISGTDILWAELRWAARIESVIHLDDLLLRRVRLGLLLPNGGRDHLPGIRAICQEELNWSDSRWQEEESRYLTGWRESYSLPEAHEIPDWHVLLAKARFLRQATRPRGRRQTLRAPLMAGVLTLILLTLWKLQSRAWSLLGLGRPGDQTV